MQASFNPCFTGLYITTRQELCRVRLHEKFQSLFYWIMYYYTFYVPTNMNMYHVSILVLLDYVLLQKYAFEKWNNKHVSILVLLDYVLLPCHTLLLFFKVFVSILVLLDYVLLHWME